ncbi:MAG: PD-(D/E)XK nuclease family protein [Succinimonas sp.]|nr:PD-(D/E)XK nuclease family protein [Succinimonas sp.]
MNSSCDYKSLIDKMSTCKECGTDQDFNIFDIYYKETEICKFIAYLLNPFCLESLPLKLFIEMLNLKFSNQLIELLQTENYGHVIINTEYQINTRQSKWKRNGRVDILITIGSYCIPIEVKLDATDSEDQCCDYYDFFSKIKKKNTYLIYLTKDGKKPRSRSIKKVPNDRYICLSFNEDIYNWLQKIIPVFEDNKVLSTLFMFCDWIMKDDSYMITSSEVQKIVAINKNNNIVSDAKSFANTVYLSQKFLPSIQTDLLVRFFCEVNNFVKTQIVGIQLHEDDEKFEERIFAEVRDRYFNPRSKLKKNEIRISYHLPFTPKCFEDLGGFDLILETKYSTYIGIVSGDGCGKFTDQKSQDYIDSFIDGIGENKLSRQNSTMYWWKITDKSANFLDFNNKDYKNLFDPDNFILFVETVSRNIVEIYNKWVEHNQQK